MFGAFGCKFAKGQEGRGNYTASIVNAQSGYQMVLAIEHIEWCNLIRSNLPPFDFLWDGHETPSFPVYSSQICRMFPFPSFLRMSGACNCTERKILINCTCPLAFNLTLSNPMF